MTTTQMNAEKKRLFELKNILFWIEEAKIKIGVMNWNIHNSNIAGEAVKYHHRIEILEESIKRFDVRYINMLNK